MFQYALMKDSKKFLVGSVGRLLLTRSKRISETELVLSSNAGIFGAYWSLKHHSQVEHPNVHIVCFPFWLDRVSVYHENYDWGQTMLGFPTIIRAIFKRIYPNYPLDKLVTWKMIQELRNFTIHELKSMERVHLYDLRDSMHSVDFDNLFRLSRNSEEIKLHFNGNLISRVPVDARVYNWVKIPRQHKLTFLPERSHTSLYACRPSLVPNPILVLGSGLSVVWLKRDFPLHQIIAIVPDKSSEFPKIPANIAINYDEIIKITVDDIISITDKNIIIKFRDDQKLEIPMNNYVSAIGYVPYAKLTSDIPDDQKTESHSIQMNSWIAPANIPVGSLTQSLASFFEDTENLYDTFELQFYHVPSIIEVLRVKFKNDFGINLEEKFFDILKLNIQNISNPLDDAGELDLFVNVFKCTQNPSTIEILLFETAIKTIQHDKNLQIQNNTYVAKNLMSAYSSIIMPPFTRSYSLGYMNFDKHKGTLSNKDKTSIHELTSVFFQPERKKSQSFDARNQEETANIFTDKDRTKMKDILKKAQDSHKTFSAY